MGISAPDVEKIADDAERQLRVLGLIDGQLARRTRLEAPPGVEVVQPTVKVSLPLPKTVDELRRFAGCLHPKFLVDEHHTVLGHIHIVAASPGDSPFGVITDEEAAPILADLERTKEAVKLLPAKRPIDDPYWSSQDFAEVIHFGEMQREIVARFGGIVTRSKPGPQPRTLEEALDIVEKWRKWKGRWSQQDFADQYLQGSRKVLTSCIRQCRDEFGPDFI